MAYESIMLGILYGSQNAKYARSAMPKIIDLQIGFSRDGFHWHRPLRKAFIASSRKYGTWNYVYLHASGGVCLVVGDELRFYSSAFSGVGSRIKTAATGSFQQENAMYAGASTGLAELRRDGFASLNAKHNTCELTTKPLTLSGKYLFVNADILDVELRM